MYHFRIEAFPIQVFMMSKARPINRIVKIWLRTAEKDCVMNRATDRAMMEVKVMVIPVLKLDNKLLLISPCLFSRRVVSMMSASTE